ncbi:MAG: type II toxin-antitoxin system VapC family toxin [Chloroflexota bacterium]|nr:type II toxin-antitoxin system VapC family toxin [Chloroflexota bacterium]
MKIEAAFKNLHRLHMDSSPLIYYVEENLTYLARMDEIVTRIEDSLITTLSSIILLPEILTHPVRQGRNDLVGAYREILLTTIHLIDVNNSIAERAVDLRARYNLRTPDALHVATAWMAGCDAILTNDTGMKRVREINVLVLDDLQV